MPEALEGGPGPWIHGHSIDIVPVPEPGTRAKNHVHPDLATTSAAHQAEVGERLKELGATPADVG